MQLSNKNERKPLVISDMRIHQNRKSAELRLRLVGRDNWPYYLSHLANPYHALPIGSGCGGSRVIASLAFFASAPDEELEPLIRGYWCGRYFKSFTGNQVIIREVVSTGYISNGFSNSVDAEGKTFHGRRRQIACDRAGCVQNESHACILQLRHQGRYFEGSERALQIRESELEY